MKFNYSAIDTALKCATKFKYQYIDKVPTDTDGSVDLNFGTAMHAAIECLLEKENARQVFDMYWDATEQELDKLTEGRFDTKALRKIGHTFIDRFERLHLKKYEPKYIEQYMECSLNDITFKGTADYIGLYEGVPSLIDFKTSAREYNKEKIELNPQMALYAYMAQKALGYKVEQIVYVVFIKDQQRIQVIKKKIDKKFIDSHIKNLIIVCNRLKNTTEFERNYNSCIMGSYKCPYYERCYGKQKD